MVNTTYLYVVQHWRTGDGWVDTFQYRDFDAAYRTFFKLTEDFVTGAHDFRIVERETHERVIDSWVY